jgi:hypothetical protein
MLPVSNQSAPTIKPYHGSNSRGEAGKAMNDLYCGCVPSGLIEN